MRQIPDRKAIFRAAKERMDCPTCQFSNPDDMRFCGGCGSELGRVCGSCGGSFPSDFRFCGQCGTSLADQPQAARDPRPLPTRAPTAEHAERRQLTVLFCDLKESTPLAESMDAEDLRSVVSEYHAVCQEATRRYEGFVAQFLGDGVLAYFGYPKAHEDDGERAVRAALDMHRGIAAMNEKLAARNQTLLQARIGIHSGPVVVGHVGREGHNEIQATGDTMNIAARFESIADPGKIVISETTLGLVRGVFETRDLGRPTLKGVSSPPLAYEVVGEREHSENLEDLTPFGGREAELASLESSWQSAQQGAGRVILLTGEAGIGKSRLLLELRRRSEDDSAQSWLTCRCSTHHQHSALHPVIDAVERAFGVTRGTSPEARRGRIAAQVERLELSDRAVPLLSSLLGIPDEGESVERADVLRRRTLRLLTDIVRRQAKLTPMVFVVEDVHWADPSTLDFLARLVRAVADDSLLVILTARPDTALPWSPPPHQTSIELGHLEQDVAETILRDWSLGRELPEEMLREIVSRTDGVPLFLEELTRGVHDSNLVQRLTQGAGASEAAQLIPATLRDSLAARLDALGPAKQLAQLCAMLGRSFPRSQIQAASDLDPSELEDQLSALAETGLLIRSDDTGPESYHFKHALFQDVAYESLLKSRRRKYHARIAQVLERDFPELVRAEPETLARHCEEAELFEEALRLYRHGAARAAARWAYVEAASHYRKALTLLARQEASLERDEQELALLGELAPPIMATSGYAAAELGEIYRRQRALLEKLGNRVDEFAVLESIWSYHCVRGDREATLEAADGMLAISQRSERPGVRARASFMVGSTAHYTGDQRRAHEYLQVAVDRHRETLDRRSGFGDELFLALLVQSWSRVLAGAAEEGLELMAAAYEFAERIGEPFAKTQALAHHTMILYDLARPPAEIYALADEALELSRKQRLVQTLRSAQMHTGWYRAIQGDEAGIDELRESIAITRAIGMLNPVGTMLTVLADAQISLGRDDDALVTLSESHEVFRTNICRHHEPYAHLLQARIASRRDDAGAAESSIRTAIRMAEGQGAGLFELQAAIELVRLVCADGIVAEAVTTLRTARTKFSPDSRERFPVEADELLADLDALADSGAPL